MKTICPHCKQEYPEVPDEYSGMTLQCSVCQKEFVCEKAKFCSECGQCNEAKALKCSQCGNSFPEDVDWTTAWEKIAVFSGRAGQKEYGLFVGQLILLEFVLGIPSLISHRSGLQIVVWFMVILSSLVSIPLCIRRLHDIGVSDRWWLIAWLLNVLGNFVPLLLIPSMSGYNKWGISPVQQHWRNDDCFNESVSFSTAWQKFAVFGDRSCRKEYGLFVISFVVLHLCVVLLCKWSIISPDLGNIIVGLTALAAIPLGIRRLHDIGVSGWWSLIVMPLNTFNYFIPLLLIPSQAGANKWGLNPVGVSSCDFNNSKNRLFRIISPFSFCLTWLIIFFIYLLFSR